MQCSSFWTFGFLFRHVTTFVDLFSPRRKKRMEDSERHRYRLQQQSNDLNEPLWDKIKLLSLLSAKIRLLSNEVGWPRTSDTGCVGQGKSSQISQEFWMRRNSVREIFPYFIPKSRAYVCVSKVVRIVLLENLFRQEVPFIHE